MQRLAEDDQIHAPGFDRRVLKIAQAELQVLQVVLLRLCRAERDDLLRVVHRNDLLAAARQQFAQQTFARAQIGDDQRRQDPQQQMPERLPGAARAIDAVKPPGDLVEINLRLFAPRG